MQEEEERQHAIDLTERRMLAKQYETQMIEDDIRDGKDNGQSNFNVIADQEAEQNYAVNIFKGSGHMAEIMGGADSKSEDERKAAEIQAQLD